MLGLLDSEPAPRAKLSRNQRSLIGIVAIFGVVVFAFAGAQQKQDHAVSAWLSDRLQPIKQQFNWIDEPWSAQNVRRNLQLATARAHHDKLLRRDFDSSSMQQVRIQRPQDPLLGLQLSDSFRSAYRAIARTEDDFALAYEQNLARLLAENKTEKCGDWQGRYTEMHQRIVSSYNDNDENDRHPSVVHAGKRIIHSCQKAGGQCGGLGDRTYGVVFSFLYALLLDRAFLAYWEPDFPLLAEETFVSPHINWAWASPPNPANLSQPASPHQLGFHHYQVFEVPPLTDSVYLDVSREELETERFPWETFSTQGNRGHLIRTLMQDPRTNWQSRKLQSLGLTTENAYGCVLNYLFEPVPQTRLLIAQYSALMTLPTVFTVSVQIRAGDWIFEHGEEQGIKPYRYFFGCATAAAEKYAIAGQHTSFVIFLVTDHNRLAREAVADPTLLTPPGWQHPTIPNFAPRVIVTGAVAAHSEKGNDEEYQGSRNTLAYNEKHYNMQSSILDNYVQDAADARVVCAWSGFGQLSSMRASNGLNTTVPMRPYGSDDEPPWNAHGVPCSDDNAWIPETYWASSYKVA